jgi:hypothetical protein
MVVYGVDGQIVELFYPDPEDKIYSWKENHHHEKIRNMCRGYWLLWFHSRC